MYRIDSDVSTVLTVKSPRPNTALRAGTRRGSSTGARGGCGAEALMA
jgi:hypothetical protein